MQTPEPYEARPSVAPVPAPAQALPRPGGALWGIGGQLSLVAGLVLALSAFTGWYSGREADGLTLAVTGWHTGALGKLVFFFGLAVLVLVGLREAGIQLPARLPDGLVLIVLGSAATVCVLVRVISIPEKYFGRGRGIGIWISLAAALAVIIAGLLRTGEDL